MKKELEECLSQAGTAGFYYKPAHKSQFHRPVYTLKGLRKLLKSINSFLLKREFSISHDLEDHLVEIIKIVANTLYEIKGKKALQSAYSSLGTPHFYIEMYVCGPNKLEASQEGEVEAV